jgi:hypothetical protein
MSKFTFFPLAIGLALTGSARAQLNIPLVDVDLAFPSISAVTINLGGTARTGLPTPFVIDGLVSDSVAWFCLDPLQTIYYSGSGKPPGASLQYASTDPLGFDKWTPLAPGLSNARLQNLADLFNAYAPTTTNQLVGGALQIAIWEIVNEFSVNSFNLATGQMKVTGGATLIAAAQSMLDRLDDVGVQNQGYIGNLEYLIDGSFNTGSSVVLVQDLVGYVTPVPESGSFALGAGGLLLALIGLKAHRRKLIVADKVG